MTLTVKSFFCEPPLVSGPVVLEFDMENHRCAFRADGTAESKIEIALTKEGALTLHHFLSLTGLSDVSQMKDLPGIREDRGVIRLDNPVLHGVMYHIQISDGGAARDIVLEDPESSDSKRLTMVGRFLEYLFEQPTRSWKKKLRTGGWWTQVQVEPYVEPLWSRILYFSLSPIYWICHGAVRLYRITTKTRPKIHR